MNDDYDDPDPDNTLGPSGSRDSDDERHDNKDAVVDAANRWISIDEHQRLADINGQKAITSRDIDELVHLKLLRKAL